jgi:hypothetical protein
MCLRRHQPQKLNRACNTIQAVLSIRSTDSAFFHPAGKATRPNVVFALQLIRSLNQTSLASWCHWLWFIHCFGLQPRGKAPWPSVAYMAAKFG